VFCVGVFALALFAASAEAATVTPINVPAGSTVTFSDTSVTSCHEELVYYQFTGGRPGEVTSADLVNKGLDDGCSELDDPLGLGGSTVTGPTVAVGPFTTSRTLDLFLVDASCNFDPMPASGQHGRLSSGSNPYHIVMGDGWVRCQIPPWAAGPPSFVTTVTVNPPAEVAISVNGQSVSATEGRSFSGTVAHVSGDPDSAPSDYSASIDWGDGSTSAGSVDSSGSVTGGHTYAEEGPYTVKTTVIDRDNPSNGTSGSSTATVGDAALSAHGSSVNSQPALAGTVASFTDQNPNATTADFTAMIDWGDGSPSTPGTVSSNASGGFDVSGSHTYAQTGPYTVKVHVADDGGQSADATSQILVYQFAAANGSSFVVGDGSASGQVEFWGAQWAKDNILSGGGAPASLKGFAENSASNPPACGGSYSTAPGNSSNPPATVPAYMGVIVSSAVVKHGSSVAGDIAHIVIVKTDPGYRPDPASAGTGHVVAQIC
jgi:hypothetical protein